MDIDPFEKVFSADIEEQPQTGGEEQLPAGDHILSINWKQLSIRFQRLQTALLMKLFAWHFYSSNSVAVVPSQETVGLQQLQ